MLRKIKEIIRLFWEMEFIRFAFAGAINTLAGWLVMTLFGNLIITAPLQIGSLSIPVDMLAILFEFICCFPLAYTLQAKIAFRQKWELKRMFLYITTILPNILIQWILAAVIPSEGLHPLLRNAIIVIVPLPIMFFIIKFVVTPIKSLRRKSADEQGSEEKKDDNDI